MSDTMTVTQSGSGARLMSVEGMELPLRSVTIRAEARGGLARTIVSQVFFNGHDQPLKATYTMPLPASGAVGGYQFIIGERRVVGEVAPREQARERFEQALVEGRTASLLDQERANLFTQELGNIPPHTEIAVEITVDQRLDWLDEGMWEYRFPTVAAPRYLGADGRVTDSSKVTVDVTGSPTGLHAMLDLVVGDLLAEGRRPESPSHRITVADEAGLRVTLADGQGVALDRDLVVRWPVARPHTGVTFQLARPCAARPDAEKNGADHAYGLLTIVPPAAEATVAIPRDLIVLLDTSGSMSGRPLAAAKRVVEILIDSLTGVDRLEMIAFSSTPRPWRGLPVAATHQTRSDALEWVSGLVAGGGTEMLSAVDEALRPLRQGAQRQVVLVTDGEVGFESEIVGSLCRHLPPSSRLHAVGIGSSVNDALLTPAARAGRGVRVVVGLDEDPVHGAARLVAATRGPVVTEIEISGSAVTGSAPRRLPDLMAGAPLLSGVETRPEGGELIARGRSTAGAWEERVTIPPVERGVGNPAVTAFYARELVEDLEMDLAAGSERVHVDAEIERVGLKFGISTRLTSWVAISEEPTVDPRHPVKRVVMPQALPYGLSAEGLSLAGSSRLKKFMASTTSFHEDSMSFMAPMRTRGVKEAHASGGRYNVGADRGRWVGALGPDLQVLEFEVGDAGLDWDPPLTVMVVTGAGDEIEVSVEREACTHAGRIRVFSLVRMVVRLRPEARDAVVAVIPASRVNPFPMITIDK